MTELNNFRSKITRDSYNLDMLFRFKQGQVEVKQDLLVTDYSDAILINKNIVQNYNQSIRSHAVQNIKQMHKSKEVCKRIRKTEWENELIQMETDDTFLKHSELQMTKVTKRMQQLIKGGSSEEQKQQEKIRLENQIIHTQNNLQQKLLEKKKYLKKMESVIEKSREENIALSNQLKLLRGLVEERGSLHKLQPTTREKKQMDKKMKDIRWERRLKEKMQNQEKILELLRNEIERLRQRSFPIFSVVQKKSN